MQLIKSLITQALLQFRNKVGLKLAVQSEKKSKILPSLKIFQALNLSPKKTKLNTNYSNFLSGC